jgi:hypothetical protein
MPGRLSFHTTPDGLTASIERMRINSNAGTKVDLVGSTSSDSGALAFTNNSNATQWSIATNSTNFYIADSDFSHYAYLAQNPTGWSWGSDSRLKENVATLDYGINTIKEIKPRRFNFIGNESSQIGFIAQELIASIPEAVSGEEIAYNDDDTPEQKAAKSLGINKETLIPVLVKALQEAIAKIETLEAEVAILKNK